MIGRRRTGPVERGGEPVPLRRTGRNRLHLLRTLVVLVLAGAVVVLLPVPGSSADSADVQHQVAHSSQRVHDIPATHSSPTTGDQAGHGSGPDRQGHCPLGGDFAAGCPAAPAAYIVLPALPVPPHRSVGDGLAVNHFPASTATVQSVADYRLCRAALCVSRT